jgi:hypothetical protein
MSQFLLYILGTIGTAVLTTIVGQVTGRFFTIGSAPKPKSQPAVSNTYPPAGYQIASTPAPASPLRPPSVNIGSVIMQAGILQLALNLIAFVFFIVVGSLLLASGAARSAALITTEILWAIVGTILLAVAFYFIGVRVHRALRWRHLIYLAVGTTILTILVNAVFEQTPLTIYAICGSAFQAFLAMGIGGAFASRAKGSTPSPTAVPTAPYGYGVSAPGSMPLYPGQLAPGSIPLYPPPTPAPGSMPPYPQAAPGSMPLYPPPNSGWNPNPAAPSVYPSAWPYPPSHAGGQMPGSMPPTPPSQPPPAT